MIFTSVSSLTTATSAACKAACRLVRSKRQVSASKVQERLSVSLRVCPPAGMLFEQSLVGLEFRGARRGEVGEPFNLALFVLLGTTAHGFGHQTVLSEDAQQCTDFLADADCAFHRRYGVALGQSHPGHAHAFGQSV